MQITVFIKIISCLKRTAIVFVLGGLFVFGSQAEAQNLRIQDDLDFGVLDFTPTGGRARLGTDSSITYTSGVSGNGLGTAGRLRIAGRSGTSVDISCSTNGRVSNGVDTIRVRGMELIEGTVGVPYGGSGSIRCQGLGTNILQLVSGNQNSNRALVGARLVIVGDESGGSYDTVSAGGDALVIEMVIP